MAVEFRRATQKDAEAYWGRAPLASFRGYVAVEDGEILGVGGIYFDERRRPIAFTEMKAGMRKHLKARAKAVRIVINFIDETLPTVYAVAQPDEPTAEKLLAKLGFVPTGEMTEMGELLVRYRTWR